MAFNIENGTGAILEIGDLGITLEIAEIVDLSIRVEPLTVSLSLQPGQELHTLITVGDVIVKDPLDGVTNLSVADGLVCARGHNDPHYRHGPGARIGDNSDVTITAPSNGEALQWNGSAWVNVTPTDGDELSKVSANDTTAGYLNGKLVAGTGITLTEQTDGGNETLEIGGAATGDLATVTAGLSATGAIPTTWVNILWPITYLENDTAVIEHDNTNIDRFLIKETGVYFISYSMSFDADAGEEQIDARILVDDTTVVPGSIRTATEDDEVNDLSNAFTASLTAGTYLTFQTQASGVGNLIHSTTNFSITRASGTSGAAGAAGPAGPPGSGTTVNVQEEGVAIPNTPHDTFNFIGDNITATDGGLGVTDITLTMPVFGTEFQKAESAGVTTTTSTTFLNKITFITSSLPAGTYRIGVSYGWNHDSNRDDFEARITEDAVQLGEIHKQEPKDSSGSFSTTGSSQRYYLNRTFYRTLTSGSHTYDLAFRTDTGGVEASMWEAMIELWRVS